MRAGRILGLPFVVTMAVACANVLDIESAKLDPSLTNGGNDGAPEESALCKKYCDTVMKNCSEAGSQQYLDRSVCSAVCKAFPPGSPGDTHVNTIECRLHFAESAAAGELSFNCSAAGPAGNGVCGSNCESLCELAVPICASTFVGTGACVTACQKLPDNGSFDAKTMQSGPSVQCRIYHATAAAAVDPDVHCPHTAGAEPCERPLSP